VGARYTSGIGIYATSRGVELNLDVFRELGSDATADEMHERLRRVTQIDVTAKRWPSVPCESLVVDWAAARSELIEPYFQARFVLSRQPASA